MSWNGLGTFIINSSGQPVVSGTTISSTVFNALTADLATGLSNCITKDGQQTITANIPMGGFKLTGLAAPTIAGDALSYLAEASYTPADTSGAGLTFSTAAGYSVKVGKLVWVSLQVTYPVTANASAASISLPYTAHATGGVNMQSLVLGNTNSNRTDTFTINRSTSNVLITNVSDGSGIGNSAYSGKYLSLTGVYLAAS